MDTANVRGPCPGSRLGTMDIVVNKNHSLLDQAIQAGAPLPLLCARLSPAKARPAPFRGTGASPEHNAARASSSCMDHHAERTQSPASLASRLPRDSLPPSCRWLGRSLPCTASTMACTAATMAMGSFNLLMADPTPTPLAPAQTAMGAVALLRPLAHITCALSSALAIA
eukprot:scaffold1146_cov339-Pavlova_lutheri.AAC.9